MKSKEKLWKLMVNLHFLLEQFVQSNIFATHRLHKVNGGIFEHTLLFKEVAKRILKTAGQ